MLWSSYGLIGLIWTEWFFFTCWGVVHKVVSCTTPLINLWFVVAYHRHQEQNTTPVHLYFLKFKYFVTFTILLVWNILLVIYHSRMLETFLAAFATCKSMVRFMLAAMQMYICRRCHETRSIHGNGFLSSYSRQMASNYLFWLIAVRDNSDRLYFFSLV
jgi:hypothetical protein